MFIIKDMEKDLVYGARVFDDPYECCGSAYMENDFCKTEYILGSEEEYDYGFTRLNIYSTRKKAEEVAKTIKRRATEVIPLSRLEELLDD